jgi:hypothetical protein
MMLVTKYQISAINSNCPKYFIIPPLPEGGGGYTVLRLSVQDIFRRIFLSNLMAEI